MFMVEVGWNAQAFSTKEYLTSWAGLCLGSYESGGIRKKTKSGTEIKF
ncbi:transposase [Enterococcus sp. BWT-B8]